jgi:hypothetical protein
VSGEPGGDVDPEGEVPPVDDDPVDNEEDFHGPDTSGNR